MKENVKICSQCKIQKEKSFFCKKTKSGDGLASNCKDCQKIYASKYYKENKQTSDERSKLWRQQNVEKSRAISKKAYHKDTNKQRARQLNKYYGLTTDQYNQMLLSQNDCCAICNQHRKTLTKFLCVDHDHKSGLIRGLLCSTCNKALGLLKDDPSNLFKAYQYLTNSHTSDKKVSKSMLKERFLI
jgi:hypothetical protein